MKYLVDGMGKFEKIIAMLQIEIENVKGRTIKDDNSTNAMVENFFKYVKTELDTSLPIIPFVENYRENLNELSVEYLSGLIEGYGEDGKKEDKKLIKILSDKLEENYVTPTETETWCRKTKRKPGNQYLRPSKKSKIPLL